jgi:hypothetical protein
MNIKITYHIMPWEIDYALLSFQQLKKSSYYLNSEDKIYIDTALNLSSHIIDWDNSKLPKEFFIEKYKTISKLLDWAEHKPFIYEGNELYGHLDLQKSQIEKHIDYYIGFCPDMAFHEHLLFYLIESAKSVKDDYFVITPQIYKMWDSTWDILTHPQYQNISYDKWNEGNIYDISHFMNNNSETPTLKEINEFKWAGWFDIYSKKLIEDLIPIPDEWKGYGPWDYYAMIVSSKATQEGVKVKEYLLENQVIFEHSTGPLKDNHFSTYYKNLLKLKDIPNQRQEIESKFGYYIEKWYIDFKQKHK